MRARIVTGPLARDDLSDWPQIETDDEFIAVG
jgi:hypothetical protein